MSNVSVLVGMYDELAQQGCFRVRSDQGAVAPTPGAFSDNTACSRECARLRYPVSGTTVRNV